MEQGPSEPSAGGETAQSVYCSDGEVVTGGGGYLEERSGVTLIGSRSVVDDATGRFGWEAAMKNDSVGTAHFWVYAICVPEEGASP